MSHKKKRRSIIDELFRGSPFSDTESFFDNFPESGYSISVVQTPEGTKVKAKAGKDTDANMLKKQLQQKYPNAKIEIEGGKKEPLIKEISTKSLTKKKKKNKQNKQLKAHIGFYAENLEGGLSFFVCAENTLMH